MVFMNERRVVPDGAMAASLFRKVLSLQVFPLYAILRPVVKMRTGIDRKRSLYGKVKKF
jgi:hypothetical protein